LSDQVDLTGPDPVDLSFTTCQLVLPGFDLIIDRYTRSPPFHASSMNGGCVKNPLRD
jgi:hypothetical protein